MAEGESELVSGFNIEYSGMKFGIFYAGELLHAFTFGGFLAILFFGGYRFFGLEQVSPFLSVAVMTLPRGPFSGDSARTVGWPTSKVGYFLECNNSAR